MHRIVRVKANLVVRLFGMGVVLAIILSLMPVPGFAQATSVILGVVKDTSGGVVPGASVTVRNTATSQVRTVNTGDDGAYRVPALLAGTYEVKVEKTGFQTATQTGLTLDVAQELPVNINLQVGTSTQEVVVNAESVQVNTTTSDLGGLVNDAKIADLPLNGRNYIDLT
ncbi:MAG: carboxypeptidase-like regulatory domain-containing protein, partial [Candidatus Acidiferrales bacterium]